MRQKCFLLLVLVLLFSINSFALAARPNSVPLPGKSQADAQLQSDTLMMALLSAKAATKQKCDNLVVVDTKVTSPFRRGTWKEEWTVNACGQKVYVPITFILDRTGTTYMVSSARTIKK